MTESKKLTIMKDWLTNTIELTNSQIHNIITEGFISMKHLKLITREDLKEMKINGYKRNLLLNEIITYVSSENNEKPGEFELDNSLDSYTLEGRRAKQSIDCQFGITLILLGDKSVGKTSIIRRLVYNSYDNTRQPTSVVATDHMIIRDVDDQNVNVKILDTAGHEQYRALGKMYYKQAHGALLVYDISVPASLDNITKYWLKALNNENENVEKILVANKTDLKNLSKTNFNMIKKGELLANKLKISFRANSCKIDNKNVKIVFQELCRKVLKNPKIMDNITEYGQESIKIERKTNSGQSKGCCG